VHPQVALKLAGGLYHRPPDPPALSKDFGNPNLVPEAAWHALAGVEWKPMDRLTASVDGFFKWQFDLAELTSDKTVRYTNAGIGRVWGFDVLIRLNPGGRVHGWVSYTYTVADRYDFTNHEWHPNDFDQTHLLNALVSVDLPQHWAVGARFRLASGFPYTGINGTTFDADADQYAPFPSTHLDGLRLPLFHALDLRIDREWIFNRWKLSAYVEVQNVYNNRAPEGLNYNYNYTQSSYLAGLPILPVFGVKGDF
jgi:outer membrane receptor protein involved in Fe transport